MRIKDRTEFGQRLLDIRQERKLSQAAVAKRVGMSQNNLSHLELNGQGSPKIASLAAVYRVHVRWLETGEGPRDLDEGTSTAPPIVAEALAQYSARQPSPTDYFTLVHTLAEVLQQSGVELSVLQFLQLADATFKKFGGQRS